MSRTEAQRKRISEATKLAMADPLLRMRLSRLKLGKSTWMKGRSHTQESKEKIRVAHIGKKHTIETIEKFKKRIPWNKGKELPAHSIETRKKMSNSHKSLVALGLHPSYRGGLTETNQKIRTSIEYRLWRENVFKRDGFKCLECGDDRGGNLEAHHMKPFSIFPELRFEVSNGKTLCKSCHRKTDTWGYNVLTGSRRKRVIKN